MMNHFAAIVRPRESLVFRTLSLLLATCVLTPFANGQDKIVAEVGRKAPDFAATGIDGKEFKLSSRLGKDKNVILLFDRAHW